MATESGGGGEGGWGAPAAGPGEENAQDGVGAEGRVVRPNVLLRDGVPATAVPQKTGGGGGNRAGSE